MFISALIRCCAITACYMENGFIAIYNDAQRQPCKKEETLMPDTSPENTAEQQRGKDMQSTRQTPVPSERLKQIFMVICGAFFLLLYAVLSVYNSAFSCFKAYIVPLGSMPRSKR